MSDKPYVGQAVHVNLEDLFVHTYHCEHCEQSSFVDVELVGPHPCECGALRRRVSDEPVCLTDLMEED